MLASTSLSFDSFSVYGCLLLASAQLDGVIDACRIVLSPSLKGNMNTIGLIKLTPIREWRIPKQHITK